MNIAKRLLGDKSNANIVDPGSFPLSVSAPSSRRIGDSNSCPPDLELGILAKCLASRCQFLARLLYGTSTALVLLGLEAESARLPDLHDHVITPAVCSLLRHHIEVTTVERPDPKGLSTFSQCMELPPQGSNSCPPDLELGALTKWLQLAYASLSVSAGFSTT